MKARFVCLLVFCGSLFAQQASQPSLTIYNADFAVVRQELPLDLKSGENLINVSDITMHLEARLGDLARSCRQTQPPCAGAELPRRSHLGVVAAFAL